MEYSIQTKKYEGPMDLLLDLISRNKIDITDISIIEITEQYLEYIDNMDKFDLDLTSDFIDMASKLLQIKSRYILYLRYNENEEDPRKELVQKIEEYKMFKELTEKIKDNMREYDDRYYRVKEELVIEEAFDFSEVDLDLIQKMAKKIFKTFEENKATAEVLVKNEKLKTIITNKVISVDSRMLSIRSKLKDGYVIKFNSIIEESTEKNEIIANFLAILELIKLKEIVIEQSNFYEDIIITKKNPEKEVILEERLDEQDLKVIAKADRRFEKRNAN